MSNKKDIVIMNQKKLKNQIPAETRISLFQTAMNNSGRNFNGKRVSPKAMADFTTEIYKLAIREIENIGELSIRQIENTIKVLPTARKTKDIDIKSLMKKIKKGKK